MLELLILLGWYGAEKVKAAKREKRANNTYTLSRFFMNLVAQYREDFWGERKLLPQWMTEDYLELATVNDEARNRLLRGLAHTEEIRLGIVPSLVENYNRSTFNPFQEYEDMVKEYKAKENNP